VTAPLPLIAVRDWPGAVPAAVRDAQGLADARRPADGRLVEVRRAGRPHDLLRRRRRRAARRVLRRDLQRELRLLVRLLHLVAARGRPDDLRTAVRRALLDPCVVEPLDL